MIGKTHIYFVPGLAANTSIFENIVLPKDKFELHFIEWLVPSSKTETLDNYVQRMSSFVKHSNVVLIGVSFGGVVVQEMKKYLNPKKVIIISSIKSKHEMPVRMHFSKKTHLHKAFPAKVFSNIEKYEKYAFTTVLKKRLKLYKKYLSMRDELYLPWAIDTIVNWKRKEADPEILHIHGDNDFIFPIKNINDCITLDGGTHIMILDKAEVINIILKKEL